MQIFRINPLDRGYPREAVLHPRQGKVPPPLAPIQLEPAAPWAGRARGGAAFRAARRGYPNLNL